MLTNTHTENFDDTPPRMKQSGISYRLSQLSQLFRLMRRSPVGSVGIVIVIFVLFVAAFGPYISPHDPGERNLQARFQAPGYSDEQGTYWLGTDQIGRDILSRVIAGTRVSVIVGLASVFIAGTFGVLYGVFSGASGGWIDTILMRITDGFLSIPFIVLAVAVSGVIGPSLLTLILVLAGFNWVTYARVVRSEVLVVREREFILAARSLGQTEPKIMSKHIIPNVIPTAIVIAAMEVAVAILAESTLSFLGLGVQSPNITWGLMLADGRQYLGSAWWIATFPGIAITVTVLGIVFLGDWLRDLLDPRLRQ